jgi:hypothetical protein
VIKILAALLCVGILGSNMKSHKHTTPAPTPTTVTTVAGTVKSFIPADYKGTAYTDEKYTAGPQVIPGKLELAYYDLGGEGVAYHDTDPINHGGNELNLDPYHQRPASTPYYWAFRKNDGMDTSYTKDFVDFTENNKFVPDVNQLYIGWTSDGEWLNYTIDVKAAGTYKVVALYSNEPKTVTLSIDGVLAGSYTMPIATGYWHHWNKADVGTITFKDAGLHLLTFNYNAGNNFAYFEFEAVTDKP